VGIKDGLLCKDATNRVKLAILSADKAGTVTVKAESAGHPGRR